MACDLEKKRLHRDRFRAVIIALYFVSFGFGYFCKSVEGKHPCSGSTAWIEATPPQKRLSQQQYRSSTLLTTRPLLYKERDRVSLLKSSNRNDEVGNLTSSNVKTEDNDTMMVQKLKEQAAKLRQEVESFEQSKKQAVDKVQQLQNEERQKDERRRQRYSVTVPILKREGNVVDERVYFRPYHNNNNNNTKDETLLSYITTYQVALPLGMILGESDQYVGAVVVDEIAPDSNAAKAGLQVGDLLRACTACKMEMSMPTWQLIAGGIGQPRTKRFMYSIDRSPFEQVLEAIGSNRMDPDQRPVILVAERLGEQPENEK